MKKKITVYCVDGPCQGETYKVKAKDKEFGLITPSNPFYKMVRYRITTRIGFVNDPIAVHTCSIQRKKS